MVKSNLLKKIVLASVAVGALGFFAAEPFLNIGEVSREKEQWREAYTKNKRLYDRIKDVLDNNREEEYVAIIEEMKYPQKNDFATPEAQRIYLDKIRRLWEPALEGKDFETYYKKSRSR